MGNSGTTTIPTRIRELNTGLNLVLSHNTTYYTGYAFLTNNGYSVNLYYNPQCTALKIDGYDYTAAKQVCMNAIYDMNGLKGPNEVGKDIGWVTLLGNSELSVAVTPAFSVSGSDITTGETFDWSNANNVPVKEKLCQAGWNLNLQHITNL